MDFGDIISLIIVFAVYLIAASSGKKKHGRGKTRQGHAPMRTRMQGEQADGRAQARDRQTYAGFGDAFEAEHAQAEKAFCDVKQMHLHEVSQQQFAEASGGEDPCHAGGAALQDEMPFDLQKDADSTVLAQEVLRGVIMSEILTRPQERAAMRRGRR